jgi:hypothetical protein
VCFNAFFRVLHNIRRRTPGAGLAKDCDGRASEPEGRLFRAAFKRHVERVDLNDPPDRERSDFDERELAEIAGAQDVYVALVCE